MARISHPGVLINSTIQSPQQLLAMPLSISLTTLVVADYDEAIDWYVNKLGFQLRKDKQLGSNKRWVVVAPPSSTSGGLLLARATDGNDAQRVAIGNQTGGRVAFFLETDDFERDHAAFLQRGVHFVEQPRHESYGKVAVFEDLYGNRWDLLQLF